MIPVYHIPENAPDANGRRKFRVAVIVVAAIVVVLLIMQSTSHRVLPTEKTSTLWGVLTGVILMTAYVEWCWSRKKNNTSA